MKEPDDSALPPRANRSRSLAFNPPVGEARLPFDETDARKPPPPLFGGDAKCPFADVRKLPPLRGGDAI